MIKQKIIRDKMRYSNLSNNMMISELWAGGTHDRHNSAPELAEHPPPLPDHAGSSTSCWTFFKISRFDEIEIFLKKLN
jgi:hypothetical protein